MRLKLNTRKLDDVVIIDMNGRLTYGEPREHFRAAVARLIDEGNRKFVLNLSDVSYVDTTGLTELVATRTKLVERGGDVNLLGVSKSVNDLLVMTKLIVVFNCFDKESEAIAALQKVNVKTLA
jgi:anti-sigma B factor antagonist